MVLRQGVRVQFDELVRSTATALRLNIAHTHNTRTHTYACVHEEVARQDMTKRKERHGVRLKSNFQGPSHDGHLHVALHVHVARAGSKFGSLRFFTLRTG